MKKLFFMVLFACIGVLGVQAQKTTVEYRDTQARLLDVMSNAYVKPLTVELEIDTTLGTNGRVEEPWRISKKEAEVDMGGDIVNIRSWGVYKTAQRYGADVIVAATFSFGPDPEDPENYYELIVRGYAAKFVNWKTATDADYEWIRMEKVVTTNEREKISAIIK